MDATTQVKQPLRTCELPACGLPAVAQFRVNDQEADQCGLHGYIVMAHLGGGTTTVYDRHGYDHMVAALQADGYEVLQVESLLPPKEITHGPH